MIAQVWVAGALFAANVDPLSTAAAFHAAARFGIPSMTYMVVR